MEEADNPLIASLKHEIRRARKPEEFEKMRREVVDLHVKHFEMVAKCTQSRWELIFMSAVRMYQLALVFSVDHGTTKKVKNMARGRLKKITSLLKDLEGMANSTFSDDVKRLMIGELKRCVR